MLWNGFCFCRYFPSQYYCQTPNIDKLSVKLHVIHRESVCIFVHYAEEENDASGFTLNLKVRIIFIIVTFE